MVPPTLEGCGQTLNIREASALHKRVVECPDSLGYGTDCNSDCSLAVPLTSVSPVKSGGTGGSAKLKRSRCEAESISVKSLR